MPRIRSVHPDALKSDKLAACSAEAERCYWRLLPLCDDEGRAEDDPILLAAEAFKKREDIIGKLVDKWLSELHDLGLIIRYKVDGRSYLQVTRWSDYQKPQKRLKSHLPPLQDSYATPTRPLRDPSHPELEVGEGDGEGGGVGEPPVAEAATGLALVVAEPKPPDPVEVVFDAWRESTGKHKAKLDPKRRRLIATRLKDYPVEDLADAVRGWKFSPHHRGENDRHTVYNSLDLLLRDAERIEKFRDLQRDGPPPVVSGALVASANWLQRRAGP